jgi:diaminohydroxyphosphoribosylaminopyrimidine deaminase/5-amino-6-(5-phosphoribosylamino)uracil reductase
VGTNTVLTDNPKLNVRSWFGENPIRIVLDRTLQIPENSTVFDGSVKTILLTEKDECPFERSRELFLEQIDFSKSVAQQICEVLQKHNIQSVIIEGGTQTLQTFIDANLWDEAMVFVGDVHFEKGIKAPVFSSEMVSEKNIKNDVLKIYRND